MTSPSDHELITMCLQATQTAAEAFGELYERHSPSLYAFLRALHPGDEHASRDALQETFVKCWRNQNKLSDIQSLKAWIFRIALNTARDMRQTAWRRR